MSQGETHKPVSGNGFNEEAKKIAAQMEALLANLGTSFSSHEDDILTDSFFDLAWRLKELNESAENGD